MPRGPKGEKPAPFCNREELLDHNPCAEREDILNMVFDLIQSLLPADSDGMPPDVERQVNGISRAISHGVFLRTNAARLRKLGKMLQDSRRAAPGGTAAITFATRPSWAVNRRGVPTPISEPSH